MAKKGMKRPGGIDGIESSQYQKNDVSPVSEIQGKAKSGKKKTNPTQES